MPRWPVILLGAILVILALQWTRSVTLPLALAVFIIAMAWPVQVWLQRRLPAWLSYIGTIVCVLAFMAAFVWLLWNGIELVGEGVAQYRDKLEASWVEVLRWARRRGVTLPGAQLEELQIAPLLNVLRVTLEELYSAIGLLGLTLIFLILALVEVPHFSAKIGALPQGEKLLAAGAEIAAKFRRYMLVRTFVSAVTGLLTWFFALTVGLELAMTWGIIAFVLNYIPFIGSILAIVPPVLFALMQSESWSFTALVFLGMTVIQVTMGNYVDPRLEGRALALSPLVVVISIFFWGLVWGVPGAFIGVPLTIGLATGCARFQGSGWLAQLLADVPRPPPRRKRKPEEDVPPP